MNKSSLKSEDVMQIYLALLDEMPEDITGAYLRDTRKELGLPQELMARLCRVSLNTYSRWERGEFLPHASGAIWLALEFLKVQLVLNDDLLLSALEHRKADTEALIARLERERAAFDQSAVK